MPRVELAQNIGAVAAAVRAMGDDRSIVNEMAKTLKRDVGAIARPAFKAAALAGLPRRNRLGEYVAASRLTVKVKRGANNAAVGLAMTRKKKTKGKMSDLPRIDAGKLRHPSWGGMPWVMQRVKPGFVTVDMMGTIGPDAEKAILAAVDAAWAKVK